MFYHDIEQVQGNFEPWILGRSVKVCPDLARMNISIKFAAQYGPLAQLVRVDDS